MLKKFIKSKRQLSLLISLLMILSLILSVNVFSSETVEAITYSNPSSKVYYTGTYYDSLGGLTKLLNGYYSKSDVEEGLRALIGYSKSGSFSALASDKYIEAFGKTISGTDNKHPKYGGTASGSLAYLWQTSEREQNDLSPLGYFRLFYSNVYGTALSNYGSSTVNREHVWPQSLSGGLFGTTGAGADIHHVRPCNGRLNNIRSNKPYADLSKTQITSTYYSTENNFSDFNNVGKYVSEEDVKSNYNGEVTGYSSSSYFEPTNNYKGDIARIFAYLIVHYPSLEHLLNNVLIGGTKTLVEWNKLDPVDSYEIQRNSVAYDYQGNRNPFIDAPELVDEIWGNGTSIYDGEVPSTSENPSTPSEPEVSEKPNIPVKTNNYKLVKNECEITSGSEIIVAATIGKSIFALSDNNNSSGILNGKVVTVSNESIDTDDNSIKWKVNRTSNGVTLESKENISRYISCPSISGTKLVLSNVPTIFSVGTYSTKSGLYLTTKSSRGILYNSSAKGFKNYSLINVGGSSYASQMNIYIKVS